jgi:hypothetical protein
MLSGWMPTIRALFVAALIFGNLAHAMPHRGLTWAAVSHPEYGKADLDLWWSWFGSLSPVSRATVEWWFRRWAWSQDQLVGVAQAPFDAPFHVLHVNQRWTLFARIAQAPERLVIEVRREGEWETLYRRLDPDHPWHDRQLSYRRIRGVWDGVGDEPKGTYKRMAKWIAVTVFTEQPDVDRVRVLLEKVRLSPPWAPPEDEVTRRAERYYKREEVMP